MTGRSNTPSNDPSTVRAGDAAAGERAQVRLVTSGQFPALSADDRLLLAELTARGVPTESAVWTDPTVDWSSCPVTVLRSTWDYHLHKEEFLAWCDRVQAVSNLQNPLALVQGNAHKGYLAALARSGLPVVQTIERARGEHLDLQQTAAERSWTAVLVKPAVSASAHGTRYAQLSDLPELQRHLDDLLHTGDALVQPYLPEISDHGELSYFFIAGEFTHAVRRASALAKGTEAAHQGELHQVHADELHLAEQVLASTPQTPLYARVDLVGTTTGQLALLELELIEPALYLRHAPHAVHRLADHIQTALQHSTNPGA